MIKQEPLFHKSGGRSSITRDHEVVVVGAGPAGSITAAFLARQGHEVLLLDQDSFPRHKTCGEALPSGVMEILLKAGLVDLFAGCLHKNRILTRTLVNKFNRFTGYCCRLS